MGNKSKQRTHRKAPVKKSPLSKLAQVMATFAHQKRVEVEQSLRSGEDTYQDSYKCFCEYMSTCAEPHLIEPTIEKFADEFAQTFTLIAYTAISSMQAGDLTLAESFDAMKKHNPLVYEMFGKYAEKYLESGGGVPDHE